MIRLKREPKEISEYTCHESNYSMPGILAGARVKERLRRRKRIRRRSSRFADSGRSQRR